jgi:metal-responsive CopG/Arc/MetJ family transcriptional regulator
MKTAISLPDDLFSAADSLAQRLGVSRSALYSAAVAEFLAKHTESEVTARLDRLYASESSALEPSFQRAQRRSLAPETW